MRNQNSQNYSNEFIGFYDREFYMFSNFSSFAVEWKGKLWQTSEHAYKAAKFIHKNPKIAEEISKARSAHDAQKISQKNRNKFSLTDEEKLVIMTDICRHKLEQHPYIQKKLLETKDLPIVEDSPKDNFWGWGPDKKGRNELGKIWQRLRKELKEKQ